LFKQCIKQNKMFDFRKPKQNACVHVWVDLWQSIRVENKGITRVSRICVHDLVQVVSVVSKYTRFPYKHTLINIYIANIVSYGTKKFCFPRDENQKNVTCLQTMMYNEVIIVIRLINNNICTHNITFSIKV